MLPVEPDDKPILVTGIHKAGDLFHKGLIRPILLVDRDLSVRTKGGIPENRDEFQEVGQMLRFERFSFFDGAGFHGREFDRINRIFKIV
jgi:hypothetical protein